LRQDPTHSGQLLFAGNNGLHAEHTQLGDACLMSARQKARWVQFISLGLAVAAAASGYWLGAFAWFGGYVSTKESVGGLFLLGTVLVAVLRWKAEPRWWPLHIVYLVATLSIFSVAVGVGQVAYFGANDVEEFFELLRLAMNGSL
jgi:hypothetical protein